MSRRSVQSMSSLFFASETGQCRPAGPTLDASSIGVTPRSYSGAGLRDREKKRNVFLFPFFLCVPSLSW